MSTNEGIHIFPNPSNGIFTVELSSSNVSGQLDLKICDLTGKQIYEGIYLGKSRYEIDLSEFAKGVYIISVNSSAKSWQSKIIID